jgi:hypothetical protein
MTCKLCGEKWTNGSFHVCEPRPKPFAGSLTPMPDVLNDVTKMIETLQEDRTYTAKTVYDKDGMHQLQPDGSVRHILYGDEETTPCTCKESCPMACKGECGCRKCHDGYQDFLSAE